MRHLKAGRKLNRNSSHRLAMFRNMVTALLERERIQTTDAKAKELRRFAERMITLGKRGTLPARRQALAYIRKPSVVKRLFDEIAPRFADRPGGYTRTIKIGIRRGDAASMSVIELTTRAADLETADGGEKKKKPRRRPAKGEGGGGKAKGDAGEAKAPRKKRAAAG
jgi:large subunit ribosomal protein L17